MSRLTQTLGVLGSVLVALGLALVLFSGTALQAQDATPEPPSFEGARECQSCHRDVARAHEETPHALALQETDRDKEPIVADFAVGEDLRTLTLPGEDAARAFTADDIAYALGSGLNAQAYLTDVNGVLRVLPAQWNVGTGEWEAITLAESWEDPAYDFMQSCAGCHTTGLNVEEAEWEDDGVMCEACHGPAELHVEAAEDAGRRASDEELAAVRAAINPGIDPQICGSCHSRGAVADGAPAYSTTFLPGQTLSVEGSYVPFGPDDPIHFYATGQASMPNMQYNEWLSTTHASSLENLPDDATDECLTCHSGEFAYNQALIAAHEAGDREGLAPEALTLAAAQFGVGCITCHDPHSEGDLPANLIAEPYALCTSCHTNRQSIVEGVHHPVKEMYEGAPLVEGVLSIPSAHFTAEDGPDCQTCHMSQMPFDGGVRHSHSMTPILPGVALNVEGLVDTCSKCHADESTPESLQAFIDDTQAGVRTRIDAIRAALPPSPPEWAVIAIDFVEGDGSYGVHNYVYADAILDQLEESLGLGGN